MSRRIALHDLPGARPRLGSVCLGGIGAGSLLALATAQVGLGLLAFVALVPLLSVIDRGASPKAAALGAWIGGVIFFGVALAWIPLSGFRGILLLLIAGYVGVLALGLAALGAALSWLRQRDRTLFLTAAPFLWITFELLRGRGSLGYPWHHLGYALASHPVLIQLAALGGVHALSLWIASVNTALVAGTSANRGRHLVAVVALVAIPLVPGLRALGPVKADDGLRVGGIQPGVVETGRADFDRFHANLRTLLDLTDEAARSRPDLVVWPESAFERVVRADLGDPFLGAVANQYETPLLTGAWRVHPDNASTLYNSAVLVSSSGEMTLAGDKVHPVPFYEATPASGFERAMSSFGLWRGRFRPGSRSGLVPLERGAGEPVMLGLLVCLDSSYPDLVRDLRRRGARVLVEISNEAQTGAWSAVQHALVSRLRAVESGIPLVRVANIGPTEWIDPLGRVIARISPGDVGVEIADLPLTDYASPYHRWGDAPMFAAGLLPFLIVGTRRLRCARATPL